MIAIENTLISDDIFTEYFCCNLDICKGCCCVEGDAGAPLDEEEIDLLENIIDKIKPYLTEKGLKVIEETGVFEIAIDGSMVTPLIEKRECAYLIWDEHNVAKCAIEKAFEESQIDFRKPISCHLYPIRISKIGPDDALNYDRWSICSDARIEGREKKLKIYQFLKEPLIRKYGKAWYDQLIFVDNELFIKKS